MTIAMTATTRTTAMPRAETHHYFGAVPIAFCARFVEAARERHEHRRMVLTAQEIDHPGVQADLEAACGSNRA